MVDSVDRTQHSSGHLPCDRCSPIVRSFVDSRSSDEELVALSHFFAQISGIFSFKCTLNTDLFLNVRHRGNKRLALIQFNQLIMQCCASLYLYRILDSMKLPGQRSGFHICDILDLNGSNADPKPSITDAGSVAALQPIGSDVQQQSQQQTPPTPPDTSPPSLTDVGTVNGTSTTTSSTTTMSTAAAASNAASSAARFGLQHQQLHSQQHQHGLHPVLHPHHPPPPPNHPLNADDAAALHQHHHYLTSTAAAAAAAGRHNAATAAAMMNGGPYGAPQTTAGGFNHAQAMLSAEWAIAASSMFPGVKPWFHDQEHYGENMFFLLI